MSKDTRINSQVCKSNGNDASFILHNDVSCVLNSKVTLPLDSTIAYLELLGINESLAEADFIKVMLGVHMSFWGKFKLKIPVEESFQKIRGSFH